MQWWVGYPDTWLLSKMKPMTKRKGELHGIGLIKRKFRRTDVSSLDDLASVVNESAACTLCQLVGTQDGTTIMPSRDCAGFLSSHFRRLDGIKKYYHFCFEEDHPVVVFLKKTATTEEET